MALTDSAQPAPAHPLGIERDGQRAPGRSLRYRLPLLIFGLMALVGAMLAFMAHREVERALRASGTARAADAARQLADRLAQSALSRTAETRELASHADLQRMLSDPDLDEPPPFWKTLLGRKPQVIVSLYDDHGRLTNSAPASGHERRNPAAIALPLEPVSPLQLEDGRIWYYTRAPVGSEEAEPLGYVTVGRAVSSSAATGLIERLMGHGAVIKLGNVQGDLWTNFSAPVPAPPVAAVGDAASFTAENGERRLGASARIDGTPWLVWVDISETDTLSPARTLARRMIPITLLFTVVAGLAVYVLSARVTSPLEQVAAAAEAIAAGDYSRRVSVARGDEIGRLAAAFNVMAARVAESRDTLEARVQARTSELEGARRELEAFSYSVSHDLRSPLRSIDGFAQALVEDCHEQLDETGRDYLARIRAAAQRMGALIDDLLALSRVTRAELRTSDVDMSAMAKDISARLQEEHPARRVDWQIAPDLHVRADPALLHIALENLLSNAWKFTARQDFARIELTTERLPDAGLAYVVRDNGAGFDMAYASKLFGAFQRLHGIAEFPGTGIGLATVQRIVRRHGGRIWADARVGHGAAFSFTLDAPVEPS